MSVTSPAPTTLVPVRNLKGGPTTFTDDMSKAVVRWEGYGDPQGQDIQQVPDFFFNLPAFQRMIHMQVFQMLDEGAFQDALRAQYAGFVQGQVDAQAQIDGAMHRTQVNDFMAVPCIGPGTVPGASCKNEAAVKQSDLDSVPPLCGTHKHLAANYAPIVGADPTTGLAKTNWAQVTVTPRATEASQGQGATQTYQVPTS